MRLMRTLAILKNLVLILLLTLAASGTVNAKLASGPQTLGPDLHQAASGLEAAPRLGWSGSSYDGVSESPVVTRGAGKALDFGRNNRKLDFLFNRNIDPSVPSNVQRAAGNAQRIGIADTPANRAEVIRRFNQSFNDPSSIVGPGRLPGSNVREFFLPGVTGTGSKVQFVEQGGRVITIIAR